MAQQTTEVVVVAAPPAVCLAVATDFEGYPAWASDIKSVVVLERDDAGRGRRVQFRAAAFGRSTTYVLRYDYDAAPGQISWVQESSDLTSSMDGAYVFEALSDPAAPSTQVTYHLAVDVRTPIPVWVKRRAGGRIVHTALRELKARAEDRTRPA